MGSGRSASNQTIVTAFHAALAHQGLVVLLIVLLLAAAWSALRLVEIRRALEAAGGGPVAPAGRRTSAGRAESPAHRLLRIGFGLIWVFDGALQAQAQMPAGMPSQVMQPAGASAPDWVQHLVNWAATVWTEHPVASASAVVWIQLGVGAMLLVAPRGRWSRAAGAVSVGWALVVWAFAEAFGGIFSPGGSWLFGLPGAVVFYGVAGALLALPEERFDRPATGRLLLRAMGCYLAGMALLEAWPGRGFWQGGRSGAIAAMAAQMGSTPQPGFVAAAVRGFGSFAASHEVAVNGVVVVALAAAAAGLLVARGRPLRLAVVVLSVTCLASWLLVQDLGFLGGVGTDPNSMVPQLLLVLAGVVAVGRPARDVAEAPMVADVPEPTGRTLRERLVARPAHLWRSLAALGTVGVVLLGAAPMALASIDPRADPIVWQAANGSIDVTDVPAPPIALVDQHGRPVSLASLRGRAVALTFLDPVCTSDCPLIAQELRLADQQLGAAAAHVAFVAVVANPIYRSQAVVDAFDQVEDLDALSNWYFLTGTAAQLHAVWDEYGMEVEVEPGGAMVAHGDIAYVVDPIGHTRFVLGADPGSGSPVLQQSFAGVLDGYLHDVLASS